MRCFTVLNNAPFFVTDPCATKLVLKSVQLNWAKVKIKDLLNKFHSLTKKQQQMKSIKVTNKELLYLFII